MTNEQKLKAKHDYFATVKKRAAMCLLEMGAKMPRGERVEPDSKEGMISLVAYVKDHKPTHEEELAADMAWRRWIEADIQLGKCLALMDAEENAQANAAK